MTVVLTPIDAVAGLAEAIDARRVAGLDRYDEWWEGVYRIVTGPSPEHGELAAWLGGVLRPAARRKGMKVAAPVNIGVDKADCRVPDIGVYQPDTPRTSPAFLATAVLVVELLSPGEVAGAKLDFYGSQSVEEVLEVDVATGHARLLFRPNEAGAAEPWSERSESRTVPGLQVVAGVVEVDGERFS